MKALPVLSSLLVSSVCYAQSATIDWANVHQVIDGFGGADDNDAQLTSAQGELFFGTTGSDLGLSILRTALTTGPGGTITGDCSSVSTSCEGTFLASIQLANSYGARIYVSAFGAPAIYTTNGSVACEADGGGGQVAASHYGDFAAWIANFVQSLQTYSGITPFAFSVSNEPDYCAPYGSTLWSASQLDTFVKSNLGPTFSNDGISTLIFLPETGRYSELTAYGSTCATDGSCTAYLGGFNFHDYDASVSSNTANDTPYPSGWPSNERYWETEAACLPDGTGPNFCNLTFDPSMTNALGWAAIIDQRVAVDDLNAWLYWWLVTDGDNGEGLEEYDWFQGAAATATVAQRAYVLGQYARFIRPGYYRIDATHAPQSNVTVSAYQDTPSGTLVIVATNYSGSSVSQSFDITNAPTFTSVTPYLTSASQDIAQQADQAVSANGFTYALPAESVTTFVGTSSGLPPPDGGVDAGGPTPTPGPVSINSGDGVVGSFVADTDFDGGTERSVTATIDVSGVANAAPTAVYQDERYGPMVYTIPGLTPGAAYLVRLHFAETFFGDAGQRLFGVSINGVPFLTNFDIEAAAGAPNRANVQQTTATADDTGSIAIAYLQGAANYPQSCGLEVLPLPASGDGGVTAGSSSTSASSGSAGETSGATSAGAGSTTSATAAAASSGGATASSGATSGAGSTAGSQAGASSSSTTSTGTGRSVSGGCNCQSGSGACALVGLVLLALTLRRRTAEQRHPVEGSR